MQNMIKNDQFSETYDKLTQELRRGILVLAVLSRLEEERYGYDLIGRLEEKGLEIEQGTLYPLLRRLESQGLLTSEWSVDSARPRRYYSLSSEGRKILRSLAEEWRDLVDVMEFLLEDVYPQGAEHESH
jgi:DNA-binding PadR family transcriptional regulator